MEPERCCVGLQRVMSSRNFDGTNDVLNVGSMNTPSNSDMTWMIWGLPETSGTSALGRMISYSGSGGYVLLMMTGNTGIRTSLSCGTDRSLQVIGPGGLNSWRCWSVRYADASGTLSLDLVSQGSALATSSAYDLGGSAIQAVTSFGSDAATTREFDGQLAHAQWWQRALSDGELQQARWYPGSVRGALRLHLPLTALKRPEPNWVEAGTLGTFSGTDASSGQSPPINGVGAVHCPGGVAF